MRKRRRLANKMTIMVCAVLIAVSAFFYVPMYAYADELLDSSVSVYLSDLSESNIFDFDVPASEKYIDNLYEGAVNGYSTSFDLIDRNLDMNSIYAVSLNFNCIAESDSGTYLRNTSFRYGSANHFGFFVEPTSGSALSTVSTFTKYVTFVDYGYNLVGRSIGFNTRALGLNSTPINFNFKFNVSVNSVDVLSGEESESYQQGYNAGYSAGEEAGESTGYSNGYSDGYEAGEQSGYDSGFQAGSDSVDTQSYYDAGYSAGYDAGYSSGYDTGYDEGYDAGWSAYEAQMDKWGADTSDYPLKLSSGNTNAYFSVHVGSDIPFNYRDSDHWVSSAEYNSNHTYKYVINFSNIDEGLDSDILYDYWDIFLNIGGIEYNITPFQDMSVSVFIPGDRISTSYSFDWVLYNCANYVADDSNLAYLYVDYDFAIYDMGPSGDTQNHIANQTDQLTNGYDDSKGNTVNSNLSTGLNDYETAENSLFATATTGMRDFTFFDFESVPAMITGMSFIGSIMGSWFNQAGGASGVGIVLSILFSVILVAMVLGLYRWYQSRGGKD